MSYMILHVKYIADRITSHDRGFSISYIVIISSFYPGLYLYVIFTNAVSILTIQNLTDFIIVIKYDFKHRLLETCTFSSLV